MARCALPQPARVVLVTDARMFAPTLFAAWTLLRRVTGPVELHFWGDGLSDAEWRAVDQVGAVNPAATVHPLALTRDDLAGARSPRDHITAAAMGRLLIASRLTGRVLYLDGDTRVTGDVAPLFAMDMAGHPIAAVRDYVTAKTCAQDRPSKAARRAALCDLVGVDHHARYFNSGVLLIDTDAVRAEPDLLAAMQDVVRASAHVMGDQDHLNTVFAGRVLMLNPSYNSSWDRSAEQRRFTARLGAEAAETAAMPDAITHFHGPRKPWHGPRLDLWSRRARAVWRFRRELAAFRARFPGLTF